MLNPQNIVKAVNAIGLGIGVIEEENNQLAQQAAARIDALESEVAELRAASSPTDPEAPENDTPA